MCSMLDALHNKRQLSMFVGCLRPGWPDEPLCLPDRSEEIYISWKEYFFPALWHFLLNEFFTAGTVTCKCYLHLQP